MKRFEHRRLVANSRSHGVVKSKQEEKKNSEFNFRWFRCIVRQKKAKEKVDIVGFHD